MENQILKRFAPYFLVAALFSALAIPLVLKQRHLSWYSLDELGYHYVTVREFQSQWPHMDFRDYPSPQTPLYHVILAAVSQVNDNITTLRFVSFAMSLASILVIEAYLMTRTRPVLAIFFTILVAISPYFLGVAVRLLTDNLALGAAIAALFALDDASDLKPVRSVSGAFLGAISVLTRQVYVWLAPVQFLVTFSHKNSRRPERILNVVLSAVPVLALVPFLLLWHGLTPTPWSSAGRFSNAAGWSINLDVPIYIFSLLGMFGSVFIFTISRAWRSCGCRVTYAVLLAAFGVLMLFVHPLTIAPVALTKAHEFAGLSRGGWLFTAGRVMPKLLGTPLIFWILFPLGLVYLYVLVVRQLFSGSYFIVVALILWILANSVSVVVLQKYYEPMLIFFVAYILAPLNFESLTEWLIPSAYLFGCLGLDVLIFYLDFPLRHHMVPL